MSKERRRVPKLRFPGFTEDWEQRKFLDLLDAQNGIRRGPFGSSLKKDSFVKKSDYVVYEQQNAIYDNYETRYFISKEKYNELIRFNIQPGDFIMSGAGTIGRISMVPDGIKKGVFNQALIRFKVNKDSINPLYFLKFMQSDMMQKQLTQANPGSAMTNLVPMDELKKWDVTIPSLEEQNRISTFINQIDAFITLHQRKLDNLKLKKKALLQKLFPKNGERYPELRFPGFTDAWEQRKLTDIAKTFIGLVTTMTENYRDSGTLLIRNSDIKEGQFIFSEKPIHLDEEFAEKNKTRRLQIGDVVTVHTGDIGTSAVIKEKEAGAIGFATINTRTDKRILNPYFLSTYFNTDKHKCYANSVSTGDGRSNYNIKDFNKLVISIPTLDEQEKISAIINNINTIITLHQRKLDHLQLQKKALLQQMFV